MGQYLHNGQATQLHHHLERPGIEEIPYQHTGGIAPAGIGGAAAPAHVRGIHHIIVQQGGGVEEFDHCGQLVMILLVVADRTAGKQYQQGAQPFAATFYNVLGNLFHQGNV